MKIENGVHPPMKNEKLLQAMAKEAVTDWTYDLGNSRLLRDRLLMRALLRLGHDDVDALLADHYGVPRANEN